MVLRAFVGPLFMSLFIILFILVMQFMALYIQEIMGKGLGPDVLGKFFYYAAGRLVLSALPVAVLMASLLAFGNMGEHNELSALKACGISLFKIMRSTLLLSMLLTWGSLWFSFDVVPKANLKFFSLYYDVQRKKADVALKPGHFYADIDGYVIRIADKDTRTGTLYDVMIYNHTENRGNNDIILADSARMFLRGGDLRMILYRGMRYEEYNFQATEGKETYPFGRTAFDSLYYTFKLEGFDLDRTDERNFRHQIILTRQQLASAIDSLRHLRTDYIRKSIHQIYRYTKIDSSIAYPQPDTLPSLSKPLVHGSLEGSEAGEGITECLFDIDKRSDYTARAVSNARAVKSYAEFMVKKNDDMLKSNRRYIYEYHFRFALPINCIVFFMIGASLGAIIRKGGLGPPALVSILFFVIFYILTTYGKKFAQEGGIEPWAGAWLSVLVCAPMAFYFTYQATMDAPLFNESTWAMLRDWLALQRRKAMFWWR